MLFRRGAPEFDVAGGGSRLLGSSAQGPGAPAPVRLPPHLYPPPGSLPIFKSASGNIAGAVGATLVLAGLEFELAKGRAGVLAVLSPFIDAPTATTDITFRVLVNGSPPGGVSGLTVIGRAAASLEKIFDKWAIELPEAARVSVTIINNDGVARRVGMQLEGWDFAAALLTNV